MDADQPPPGCANRSCAGDCHRARLTRRTFLALSATGIGAMSVPGQAAAALPEPPRGDPLSPQARATLAHRGRPTSYTGAALPKIGMPVGGGCAGQVYLAGDGRLWAWDIFNPNSFPLGGANFSGSHYANPLSADQPGAAQFGQGFALRTTSGGRTTTRRLDASGFTDVRFTGQYPIGRVDYAAPDSPVRVRLDAFSPFIPLATLDSTLPATVLAFTVHNTTSRRVKATLSDNLWMAEYGYYVQKTDPQHPSVNTNRGCFIDQMYGQTYASQLGLPRVFPADQAKTALGSIYQNNFQPDPASYRPPGVNPGRVYTASGEAGTVMTTWPHGGSTESGGLMYFDEVWTGQEYEFAAQLMAEGMVTEGLSVIRAVHDRYSAEKRNPYNEIEASDHYARAMMGFGVYLAACGYEYHGPKGHLGFAPKLGSEDFRCAFTTAEGWGLYKQVRDGHRQTAGIEIRYGRVRLATLAFETAQPARHVTVRLGHQRLPATHVATGNRTVVTLDSPVTVPAGGTLTVVLT